MIINKIYIFDTYNPTNIQEQGIVLCKSKNNIIYINKESKLQTLHKDFFFKQVSTDVLLSKDEKMMWFYIFTAYIKNTRYTNTIQDKYINTILLLLCSFAPYKRRKYFISKLFNFHKKADCPICFENCKMVKLHNSNHYVCMSCFLKIDKCPICREPLKYSGNMI